MPSAGDIAQTVRLRATEVYDDAVNYVPGPRNLREWLVEKPARKKKLGWWVFALVCLISLAVASPRLTRTVKSWQARRQAQQALTLIDQQNWNDAAKKLRSAFQLRETEPAVWIAYARLLSRTGQGDLAMEWWQKIDQSTPLSLSDHRDYALAAISARELTTASERVDLLLSQPEGPVPADLLLAGELSTLRGYNSTAMKYATQVLSDHRSDPREVLAAHLLILRNTDPPDDAYKTAFAQLLRIARDERNSASAQALAVIAQQRAPARLTVPSAESLDPVLPEGPAEAIPSIEIADRLDNNPNSRGFHHMLAFELRWRADPPRENELIERAIHSYSQGDDETLIALGSWLYSHNRFQSVLTAVPLERAVHRRELLMQRIDALGALGRMEEVKNLLLGEQPVIEQSFQHMYLAVVCSKLGETAAVPNEWNRAVETAEAPYQLLTLAQYAEKNLAPDIADAAYRKLKIKEPGLRAAYMQRLRLLEAMEQTATAHEVARTIADQWPDDISTRFQEMYLRLLLGASSEEAKAIKEQAEAVSQQSPWHMGVRMTLALARLKLGQNSAALAAVSEFREGEPMSSEPLAVRAAALNVNGWRDKAREEAGKLATAQLLPEERALIAPLLNR